MHWIPAAQEQLQLHKQVYISEIPLCIMRDCPIWKTWHGDQSLFFHISLSAGGGELL
jgi:hypothetical protein